jgi:hypothetical protein
LKRRELLLGAAGLALAPVLPAAAAPLPVARPDLGSLLAHLPGNTVYLGVRDGDGSLAEAFFWENRSLTDRFFESFTAYVRARWGRQATLRGSETWERGRSLSDMEVHWCREEETYTLGLLAEPGVSPLGLVVPD